MAIIVQNLSTRFINFYCYYTFFFQKYFHQSRRFLLIHLIKRRTYARDTIVKRNYVLLPINRLRRLPKRARRSLNHDLSLPLDTVDFLSDYIDDKVIALS